MYVRLGLFASILIGAAGANAGTICRSTGFVGYQAQARRAVAVVGPETTDLAQARVYFEPVGRGYYYQTNYVEPGAAYPAKLLSEVVLPTATVLANLLYPTPEEARRNVAVTAAQADRIPFYSGSGEQYAAMLELAAVSIP